jgi:hypothetical protein
VDSPEYNAWANMTARCENPTHPNFKHYGARGIRVFSEWLGRGGFARWLAHVGRRPSALHSIERIDNENGYVPGNLRWATRGEQMRNTRANHWIEIDGERHTVSDWATLKGLHFTTIHHRLARGMSERDAVCIPPREGGRRMSKKK